MNEIWGHVIGVITLVLMLIFIGIWVWAWRPSHRRTFDRLARLPMHDARGSTCTMTRPAGNGDRSHE
jgi:cytochrome c oxidase cbb3-type subunit IV